MNDLEQHRSRIQHLLGFHDLTSLKAFSLNPFSLFHLSYLDPLNPFSLSTWAVFQSGTYRLIRGLTDWVKSASTLSASSSSCPG